MKIKQQKFSTSKLSGGNCAQTNQVFLLCNHATFPYLRPVKGWEIIGFGQAPWPGLSNGFCAVFERILPEDKDDNNSAPEGTIIWQHMNRNHYNAYISGG